MWNPRVTCGHQHQMTGSAMQDMTDLYAIKWKLAALQREDTAVSGGPDCGGAPSLPPAGGRCEPRPSLH